MKIVTHGATEQTFPFAWVHVDIDIDEFVKSN